MAGTGASRPSPASIAPARQLLRYGLAIVGPIGVAGSQFLVSLTMIHMLTPGQFGAFSLLMVANVLSWGICSALFCAPMPILLYQPPDDFEGDGEAMLVAASAAFAFASSLLFAVLAWILGLGWTAALLFAGYAWASVSRYFARSHALARHDQIRATLSDIGFSLALTAGLALAWLAPRGEGGMLVYAALLTGALVGLLPFGWRYIVRDLMIARPGRLRGYGYIWKRMSAWSVLGVVTTEATNNAHAYLVTSFLGPSAFAPLAASGLVTRPVSVISTALSDFERPRLARQIGEGRFEELRQSLRLFGWSIAGAWGLTALAVIALFLIAPRLIFPVEYDLGYVAIGALLWMLVAAARMAAIPPSCLLIACGSFRLLANTSLWSGLLSVAAVILLMLLTDPLWSIVGILLGQSLYAFMIRRSALLWLGRQRGPAPRAGDL